MKNKIRFAAKKLFLAFLIAFPFIIQGQSITEKMGGVITNFTIKSDTIIINQDRQLLIKRGVYDYESEPRDLTEWNYNYGYGYQSYHLEFTSTKKIQLPLIQGRRKRGEKCYKLSLINNSGVSYQNIYLKWSDVRFIEGQKGSKKHYAYSINLCAVPLIELDDLAEFNIVETWD